MSWVTRREIPLAITVIVGVFLLLNFFFTIPIFSGTVGLVTKIASVLIAISLGVGVVSLVSIHGRHIKMRTEGQWPYSAVLLFMLATMIVAGLQRPVSQGPAYLFIYQSIHQPLTTTIYSLVAFYMISAAYRTLRARTGQGALLCISAFLIMLGNLPSLVYYLPAMGVMSQWITDIPNAAGWRGWIIATGIGAVMLGIRVLVGIEKGYLSKSG